MMVRDFHKVIGEEARRQILEAEGRLPDAVFACVGGGSNAIGIFHAFIPDAGVQLIGVEAGGRGDELGEHAARYRGGAPGVLQGAYSYRAAGRRRADRADAFGLGRPGLRHDRPRARLAARSAAAPSTSRVDDAEALAAARLLSRTEGIIPALESRARRRRSDPARARRARARSSS